MRQRSVNIEETTMHAYFEGAHNGPLGAEATPVPKYHHVKESILARIIDGSWAPDMLIPSETELGKEFEVSRITIRRAISELVHSGRLRTVQGKGTFVAKPKLSERFMQRAFGFYEDMERRGLRLTTKVVRQEKVPASAEVATQLNIKPTELVQTLTRIRSVEDEKLLISTTYLPASLCPDLHTLDLSEGSLYRLLSTRYGLAITRGLRSLEAVSAAQEEARALDIALGSPLLLLESVAYLADGRAFEFSRTYHRGDRARVEVEFAPAQEQW
jgi:GntR family transcriptional regulator